MRTCASVCGSFFLVISSVVFTRPCLGWHHEYKLFHIHQHTSTMILGSCDTQFDKMRYENSGLSYFYFLDLHENWPSIFWTCMETDLLFSGYAWELTLYCLCNMCIFLQSNLMLPIHFVAYARVHSVKFENEFVTLCFVMVILSVFVESCDIFIHIL